MDQQEKAGSGMALEPVDPQPVWNPIFLTRQNFSKSAENLPYLVGIYSAVDDEEADDEEASDEEVGDEEANDGEESELGVTEGEDEAQTIDDATNRSLREEDQIKLFMRDSEGWEHPELCTPQADALEDICCGARLNQLDCSEWEGESVALLDEGCFVGDTFQRREYENPGPLNSRGIYSRLAPKVRPHKINFHT
jgi:hypothetical protein